LLSAAAAAAGGAATAPPVAGRVGGVTSLTNVGTSSGISKVSPKTEMSTIMNNGEMIRAG
jgi:hypothetical protein